MSPLRDQILKTAQGYLDGLNDPGPDAAGVIALRTPDCTQRILPQNLQQPVHTNESYQAFMGAGSKLMVKPPKFAFDSEPLVDEHARKVVLHMLGKGESPSGPYNNEYFIILSTTDDGTKIKEVVEFLDSRAFTALIETFTKLTQESAAQS
ncbi:uncharacterized protein PV06_08644 [Exophiala oligosperma]|uniref:SnoaL-like domain-containing protein n=2 Tax=Chaetothyriales TaxID=34395 RepID=A0A0D2D8L4_9EURO|nr:uncharacterized protein PV06_08644 [Exophiala oligosperma]KAJ9634993.1 hypothetical protein H2204_005948 [Knufia peltigerae]KIW38805.1 hypothetical protein PV06_08644 [Exophiala oligosperma]